MSEQIAAFFAYPSEPPSIPETVLAAIRAINNAKICRAKSWQESRAGGKFIIDVICRQIDDSQIFCADLTNANPNVMFELGYAIARRKRIWLMLDSTIESSKKVFDQLRILTTVGYSNCCNSQDIVRQFMAEKPWEDIHNNIFDMSIVSTILPEEKETLLYLKSRHETEASIRLTSCIDRYKMPVTIDDPKESSVQPLAWYAKKILAALGVVVHFSSPSREGASLHNSRYAFVSGLAHGFQKKVLMLAETDYPTPIDYRDLMGSYRTSTECLRIATEWLDKVSKNYAERIQEAGDYLRSTELALDLRHLRVGEHIAENEENELQDYFVETSAFLEALVGRHTLIVGRKGAGKTAILYEVARRLSADKRNLVCVVKPPSYELESILRLIRQYRERDEKGFLVESLWKFLLYSEIAKTLGAEIQSKLGTFDLGSPQDRLLGILSRNRAELCQEFSVRLERAAHSLLSVDGHSNIEGFRVAVSEKLHGGLLKELRVVLGEILTGRKRVALLIDNLDKAWDKHNDLDCLSDFLLGLLRVSRDIKHDFERKDYWRDPVSLTLTVFLRSDIFAHLMRIAREPDKISFSRLLWDDQESLLRVIDERLAASRGRELSPKEVWQQMFCSFVRGLPVREYVVQHVLARPRDIVFFMSAAIATAVNRAHSRVEERDFHEAEKMYSQFAFDSMQVENSISLAQLEAVLFEFAGQQAILTEGEVLSVLAKAAVPEHLRPYAIRHLCTLSFLGVEVHPGDFVFASEEEESQKNDVVARHFAEAAKSFVRYKVNSPFHSFLGIA